MKIKNLKVLVLFLVGIFSIVWIFNFFSGSEALALIKNHESQMLFLFIAHIPTLFFDSLSWMILMKKKNFGLLWSFIITWISQTAGKIMPTGNVTGEFVRIYLSVKKGMSTPEASSTVIGDLAIATFSLLLMAIISFSFVIGMSENVTLDNQKIFYIVCAITLMIFLSAIFIFCIRKRLLKKLVLKFKNLYQFSKKLKKTTINIIRLDYELYKLSFKIKILLYSLFLRLFGWIGGAFEIYVFLFILGIDVSLFDVIIIEAFTGIARAVVFFIPAGLGVQEFAFILIGNFVGLSTPISFAMAIGRRIREILVGLPAIITWYVLFSKIKDK